MIRIILKYFLKRNFDKMTGLFSYRALQMKMVMEAFTKLARMGQG